MFWCVSVLQALYSALRREQHAAAVAEKKAAALHEGFKSRKSANKYADREDAIKVMNGKIARYAGVYQQDVQRIRGPCQERQDQLRGCRHRYQPPAEEGRSTLVTVGCQTRQDHALRRSKRDTSFVERICEKPSLAEALGRRGA